MLSVRRAVPRLREGKTVNHADRCDKCGAQAFVQVTFKSGDLLFCKHHANTYESAYITSALAVLDESDKINTKPSISANAA